MDLQGFPAMTSYSSKLETGVERRGLISSPDSHSRPYTHSLPPGTHNNSMPQNLRRDSPSTSFSQDQYSNSSTPVQSDPPRYPKSSQRTLNNYAYHSSASYLNELARDGVHTNPTMGEPRYPSSAEAADTYTSNFDVRTSSNLPSTSLSQHGSDEHVSDYRNLREYPSQDFEQNDFGYRRSSFQPLIRDDLRHSTINGTGFLSANQAMSHSTSSRRSSATTSDRVLHSPVSPSQEQSRIHHRHSQHHQHQYAPRMTSIPSAEYITSYTSRSAAPCNTHPSSTLARLYQTHTSSFIPMVNTRQLSQNANEKQAQASLNYALANNLPESQSQQYQSPRPSFISARFDRPAITHSHSSPELRVQSASNALLGHLKSTHSPLGVSDSESATGSDYAATHDNDDDYEKFRGGRATSANYSDGKLHSTPSGNLQGRNGKRILTLDTEATSSMGAGDRKVDALGAVKKKKKSKMHECTVCHKKFPRPSGLKTHMNTHNNEKPFPCGFPGCPRTFGVRSNAKRHLRTHGVQPRPASATRTEPLYVVGFQPPITFPPQNPGQAFPDGLDGRASSGPLLDGADEEEKHDPSSYEHGVDRTSEQSRSEHPVKLKWMPLSLMSRTNASSLREVEEGHSLDMVGVNDGHAASSQCLISNPWSEGNNEGYYQDRRGYAHRPGSDTSSKDIEYDLSSTDYEQGEPYSDMTAASRLRIPLRSAYRSRSAEYFSKDSDSILGASSMSGTVGCHCNPQCPRDTSGLMKCCSGSVASGSSSFQTSSGFDSTSLCMMSRNKSEGQKLNIPELESRAPPSWNDNRGQHPPYQEPSPGSYSYHPSQFHGLPRPAPTSVVLSRPYMMV